MLMMTLFHHVHKSSSFFFLFPPVTKQSYEFEITPDFRRRIDRWHVKKEGMGQVGGSGSGPQSGRETANASRANSRYSQTSGAYDKEVVTRW